MRNQRTGGIDVAQSDPHIPAVLNRNCRLLPHSGEYDHATHPPRRPLLDDHGNMDRNGDSAQRQACEGRKRDSLEPQQARDPVHDNLQRSAHYDGIYAWNPQTKSINFWYTSAEGELTIGTAQADEKGLEQEFDVIDAAGNKKHLRSHIRRDGPDAYSWNVEALKDGTWTELIHLRYTRE